MAEHEWAGEAREHFERGYEEQMAGRIDAAIECYGRSIAIQPTAEAHTFLGWAFSHQGRHEDAIVECRTAIAVDPTFGNPYNDIGAYFIELGWWKEAVLWLEKALVASRYENREFAHMNLGRVYEHLGQWEKALKAYKAALALNPSYMTARQALRLLVGKMN